jgi:autotransporter-associated beta strand protein
MMIACGGVSADTLYWGGTSGQSWTSATWSENGAEPYATPWVSGADVVFDLPNSIIAGASTQISGIVANQNVTVNPSGTLGTGGTVATVSVAEGKTLNFGSQAISTAAGTGFIKQGAGTWVINGSAYGGGFTLEAGTVGIGGVNALGSGGVLNIDGGTLQTSSGNAARDLSGKFPGGIVIGGDFSLSGGGGLKFSNDISLGAPTRAIHNSAAAAMTLAGNISGDPGTGLVFNGSGATVLGGVNTYDGGTIVNSGILTFAKPASIPTSGVVSVAAGATLGVAVGGVGSFSETDVTSLFNNSFPNVNMANGSLVGIDTTAGPFNFNGPATGAMGLTKLGGNHLRLFSFVVSYTGGTHVPALSNGLSSVEVSGDHSMANGGWRIGYPTGTGSNGSTLVDFTQYSSIAVEFGRSIAVGAFDIAGVGTHTLNVRGEVDNFGSLTIGGQGIVNMNASGTWNQVGEISLVPKSFSNATFNVNAGSEFKYLGKDSIKLSGASLGTGKALLNINGGLFETSAGFASVAPASSSGYGRITLSNYGTLRILGDVTNLTSQVQFALSDGGGIIDTWGDTTLSGITTGPVGSSQASGISGSGNLIKEGSGKLTLTGVNTYDGITTVARGSLFVNGALTRSWVQVTNGATLGGAGGVIGSGSVHVLIDAGGTLAPGTSAGTLEIDGNATIAGTYSYEFDGGAGGANTDLLEVSGTLDLTGATLMLANLGTYNLSDKFTLISYGSLTGTFVGYPDDGEFEFGGGRWRMNYNDNSPGLNGGGGAIHVTMTAVPETACPVMAIYGMVAMLRRSRRR